MKKLFIPIIITILLATMVSAVEIEPKEIYTIDTISPCYGSASVYVKHDNNESDYTMAGCVNQQTYWMCQCEDNNTLELMFQTHNDIEDTFNFEVQFYINEIATDPENDSSFSPDEVEIMKYRRTAKYEVVVGKPVKEKTKVSDFPPLEINNKVIVGIFIFVSLFIFIILIIWRQFTKEQKPEDDHFGHNRKRGVKEIKVKPKKQLKQKGKVEDYPIKDEINDILKGL